MQSTDSLEATSRTGAPGPLQNNRDFRLLMIGNAVNDVGTAIGAIAVVLAVYHYSKSPVLVGLVDALEMTTIVLCGIPAGWAADRFPKKILMAAAALLGGVAYGAFALLIHASALSVPAIVLFVLCVSAGSSVYRACGRAALRAIVEQKDIPTATSFVQARGAVAAILGPPVGGLLYGIHGWLPLAIDAVSYLLPVVCVVLIGRDLVTVGVPQSAESGWKPMLVGIRFIFANKTLRSLTVVGAIAGFASSGYTMSLIVSLQQRHFSPTLVGGMQAALATGMVVGAVISPLILKRFAVGSLVKVAVGLAALSFAAVAVLDNAWLMVVALFAGCLLVVPMISGIAAYEAMVVPLTIQGRVSSADEMLTGGLSPVAPLLGGFLLARFGHVTALLAFAVLLLAAAGYASVNKDIRKVPLAAETVVG